MSNSLASFADKPLMCPNGCLVQLRDQHITKNLDATAKIVLHTHCYYCEKCNYQHSSNLIQKLK